MIWLGERSNGRDNNFNLIRMVAATAVLVSHAWPLVHGPGTPEPLEALTGYTLGTLAVYVFFALSGFFIASSYARLDAVVPFLAARGLRLFPGLVVSLIFVGLVMGPLATSLPVADYLARSETWTFFLRNITLLRPQYTLPGLFETNPYPSVEGSIWTLIHEVLCYGLVFLAGVSGLLRRRALMTGALVAYLLVWLAPAVLQVELHPKLMQWRELSFPFVLGMAFWLWRDRIPLTVLLVGGTLALAWLTRGTVPGFCALMLFITYTTFWLGHRPEGPVRAYNRFGDYSYGMYIYAFPLQGLVVWLFGPMTPAAHIALALPLTLVLAVLSWHFVEGPALRQRPRPASGAATLPNRPMSPPTPG